ncbi:transcription initiation factor TFIID subunit 3 isoform X2 [Lepisosteus oculatus]|uniref:transcription initiation factor TFIID subunit 3 isoform X2 n=1 Tax=Lepisosteus oculatus TaxID=7918 RepID=UPI0037164C1F
MNFHSQQFSWGAGSSEGPSSTSHVREEEEEEEQVLTDGGTSAEAMQVPLEEEGDLEEEETVNDENFLGKRPLDSPDSMDMPVMKRPRLPGLKSESPEVGLEPREPLTSINPQKVPPMPSLANAHDSSGSLPLSPELPVLAPSSKMQLPTPKISDTKPAVPIRKPKITSPGQKTKSPKGTSIAPVSGSPIRSPKAVPKEKKSPGRTKSPKSPKSPKVQPNVSHPTIKPETPVRAPLAALSEKMGKENILSKQGQGMPESEKQIPDAQFKKLSIPDNTIDDSIDAVIARACAEPDPFAFSSGSESEGEIFQSPRRLTISEPATPKLPPSANSFGRDTSTPVPPPVGTSGSDNSWTMDDSINEVLRKVNLATPSSAPPNPPYMSSPSASPPTPEPLLKVYEEKNKLAASVDVKKKLKKELKTKMKKKEKDKQKEKEKERDKDKSKEKNREKNKEKEKEKEFIKEAKLQWKDFTKEEDREQFKAKEYEELDIKVKSKDGSSKKEKDKHKDKKKDKERTKKDKEKKDKGKDKAKEEKQKTLSTPVIVPLKEAPLTLFAPPTGLRIPPMLPSLPPILSDKLFEEKEKPTKEKEKKKDKKEKKKKKDKDKEKEKEKEKEKAKDKEEKKKEKEKKDKEKEKEKEKHKHEKVKVEPLVAAPSPVIPRLTLRVGAGQDKIVISKVVSTQEAKTPAPRTPVPKAAPACRPRTPPPPPTPAPAPVHVAAPPAPAPQPPPPPAPAAASPAPVPPPSPAVPAAGSSKTPVRSVVTETVSTYVIRDEWGNQIWICPGCNKPDDGSPMIGCDDCDDWYHWPCVGITAAPPEEVQWYCPKCANKKKDKKHKKRKHKMH